MTQAGEAGYYNPDYTVDLDAPTILRALTPDPPPIDGRFAIVDPAWNGLLNPRLLFDGEIDMGFRTYQYLGVQPRAGARVLVKKMGDSWVIIGPIGEPARPMGVYMQSATAAANITTTPYTFCQLTVPDPGYEYQLMASAAAMWKAEDTGTTVPTQWDMIVVNNAGSGLSRQVVGLKNTQRRGWAGFVHGATKYTGTQLVKMQFVRVAGSGKLVDVWNSAYSGMIIFQIPTSR